MQLLIIDHGSEEFKEIVQKLLNDGWEMIPESLKIVPASQTTSTNYRPIYAVIMEKTDDLFEKLMD